MTISTLASTSPPLTSRADHSSPSHGATAGSAPVSLPVGTPTRAPHSADTPATSQTGATPETARQQSALQQAVTAFETRTGAKVSVALAPLGATAAQVQAVGSARSMPAWSTAKVWVALASIRSQHSTAGRPDASTAALIEQAITRSDNEASEQLFRGLGSRASATRQVQTVVRSLGDQRSIVPEQVTRPPWSSYGQTEQSVELQALTTARLACAPDAAWLLTVMGRPAHGLGFGLARLPGAQSKAGWGPGSSETTELRQLAVVDLDGERVAVAIIVQPADGGFAAATTLADELTRMVARDAVGPTGGACPGR